MASTIYTYQCNYYASGGNQVKFRSSRSTASPSNIRAYVPGGTTVYADYDDGTWIGFNYTYTQSGVTNTEYGYSAKEYFTLISSQTSYNVKVYWYSRSSNSYYEAYNDSIIAGNTYSIPAYYGSIPSEDTTYISITFRKNNGTADSNSKQVSYKTSYSHYGYSIFGSEVSNLEPRSITAATTSTSVIVNSDLYIYASFNGTRYTIDNIIDPTVNYPGFVNQTSNNTYTATFYEDGVKTKTLSRTITKTKAFKGWSASSSGSVISSPTGYYSNTTLYAIWNSTESTADTGKITLPSPTNTKSTENNIYTVSFNNSSGNNNIASKYAGSRTYSFGGWHNSNFTSRYGGSNEAYDLLSNISMYSKWTSTNNASSITLPTPTKSNVAGSSYQVTINPDNGETANTYTVYVGKKTYTFAGWYKDSSFSNYAGGAGASYSVSSTHTLYAKWNETITNGINISNPNAKSNLIEDVTTNIYFGASNIEDYSISSTRTTKYTFSGWYNGSTKVTNLNPFVPTADVTLKAKWTSSTTYANISIPTDKTRREYENMTVILHSNYGTDQTDEYAEEKTSLYDFLGLFTAQSGGSNVDSNKTGKYTPSKLTTNLYAHWELNSSYVDSITLYDAARDRVDGKEYVVYYNGNGGDPARGSDVIVRGRIDYTFAGWWTAATGGSKITSPYKPVQSKIHFYAHWTSKNTDEQVQLPTATRDSVDGQNVTVTFDSNGGLVLGNSTASKTVSIGGKRYTFEGWYDKSSNGTRIGYAGDNYYPNTSDDSIINLYANWNEDIDDGTINLPTPSKQDIKEYKVVLNAGDGLIGTSNTKQLTAKQGTIYKFNGWYDGTTKIESPYSPTDDITLMAGWLIDSNVYEPITFETPVFNTSKSININLYENKSTSDITKIVKAITKVIKKDFKGWYLDNERLDASSDTYMPSRDNINIIARWDNAKCDPIIIDDIFRDTDITNYTITLNSNGGTIDEGISSLSASRSTAHEFTGWYDARGGNNKMTNSNKEYTPDPNSTSTEIDMYAHWKDTPSTVKATLPNADKAGYAHIGWSTDGTRDGLVTNPYVPVSGSTTNLTLYAIYTYKGKVKINGKYYMPIVYKNGKWYKLLPEIFKNGAYRETGYKE